MTEKELHIQITNIASMLHHGSNAVQMMSASSQLTIISAKVKLIEEENIKLKDELEKIKSP